MADFPRLIEYAFPLKQTSLDSVHEKNVRHGHISTLHIWPARRPLAACRAALIATLLPDPGDPEKRQELCEKIAGTVVKKIERKKMPSGQTVERVKEETEGGILHWGRETENAETLDWFRQEIRKAYGGRAPKVLDPFAGGGAIPLEAMRLGCEATAVDINPVAWFILKCTLEYPQKLAGQTRPLPDFILHNDAFMAEFFKKAKGYGKAETRAAIKRLHGLLKKTAKWNQKVDQQHFAFEQDGEHDSGELEADLAWHVRAWGQWVLDRARRELAQYYPTYADFEPLKKDHVAYEHQPMRLVPLKEDGTPDIDGLNSEFTAEYLEDKRNPRWIAKPTVAYLWARTVTCKNCRATVPLLKTRWLCKRTNKRVLLTMEPNADRTATVLGVEANVLAKGGNAAQKREYDKRLGAGTMNRAGAKCPCCQAIMTMQDIQVSAKGDLWGDQLLAVVVDGQNSKEYREVQDHEYETAKSASSDVIEQDAKDPMDEPISEIRPSPNARGLSGLTRYGITTFGRAFGDRQRLALRAFAAKTYSLRSEIHRHLSCEWSSAVAATLAIAVNRVADRNSMLCHWDMGYEKIAGTFQRYALRVNWDYCEVNPFAPTTGNYSDAVEWISRFLDHALIAVASSPEPEVSLSPAQQAVAGHHNVDLILTDPPYYDAIPYADLSDFFYVWLRRSLGGTFQEQFSSPVTVKTEELIQHALHSNGDHRAARQRYEDGMAAAFTTAHSVLSSEGRFVVVFAHKQPDAWETLVAAIIRAGFVVDASWPIQTEMPNKAAGGARLASSVWMVCKKRPSGTRPGWDNNVIEEMRANIAIKLREFWDAGIRGPDFVWAATGPAMEAYSKHPVVRKANEQNATMGVGEFLNHVRRMVVDYVVGQVLTGEQGADMAAADRLDEVSAYYLLHRHDFGMNEAPVGACILYATACSLSDGELDRTWDILTRTGSASSSVADDEETDEPDGDAEPEKETGGGSKVKLKPWNRRRGKSMGHEAPEGKAVPLIDRIHRLMHLWKDGDVQKVDEYLDQHALRGNELFKRVVQSLIELSTNNERSLLESISNHVGAKGVIPDRGPTLPFGNDD